MRQSGACLQNESVLPLTDAGDAQAIKDRQWDDWDRAAATWRKYDQNLRQASASLTARLLELAAIGSGNRVLDVASGTGEPGLPAAQLVGPSGVVLLTDQSAEMLAIAQDKARTQDLRNVEFRVVDAEQLELEPESFDAALCRSALPLMPDPLRCLRTVFDALKQGGRIALSVTGPPQRNPYFAIPFIVFRRYGAPPRSDPATDPFALSDPDRLRAVMNEVGFREVVLETLEHGALFTGYDYWDYLCGFSATASALAQIPRDQHVAVAHAIAAAAAGGDPDAKVELRGESLLAVGTRLGAS